MWTFQFQFDEGDWRILNQEVIKWPWILDNCIIILSIVCHVDIFQASYTLPHLTGMSLACWHRLKLCVTQKAYMLYMYPSLAGLAHETNVYPTVWSYITLLASVSTCITFFILPQFILNYSNTVINHAPSMITGQSHAPSMTARAQHLHKVIIV